jgi:hypothetical protein
MGVCEAEGTGCLAQQRDPEYLILGRVPSMGSLPTRFPSMFRRVLLLEGQSGRLQGAQE